MNKDEYNLILIKQADDIVDYCNNKGITIKQYFEMKDKQQYAIEKKEIDSIRKINLNTPVSSQKYSCYTFIGKTYESDEREEEYGQERDKWERENEF